MKKSSLAIGISLAFSIILTGCSDAEIASYAAKNNIPMTPELVNSIKQASQQQNPSTNGKTNGKNNPTNPNPNGNANGLNNPNNPHNPNNVATNEPTIVTPTDSSSVASQVGNVTVIPGPVGPQGPQGPAGPQGEKGDSGDDGADGKDGRGIKSLKINDEGHLIAYYTDDTEEDCGVVRVEETPTPIKDYEKAGYILDLPCPEIIEADISGSSGGQYHICLGSEVKLKDINDSVPSRKYHYVISFNIVISNSSVTTYNVADECHFCYSMDNNAYFSRELLTDCYCINGQIVNGEYTVKRDIYTSMPLTRVTQVVLETLGDYREEWNNPL